MNEEVATMITFYVVVVFLILLAWMSVFLSEVCRQQALRSKGNKAPDRCELCAHTSGMLCGDISDSFVCTREEGHDGDHAACGSLKLHHPLKVWGQK